MKTLSQVCRSFMIYVFFSFLFMYSSGIVFGQSSLPVDDEIPIFLQKQLVPKNFKADHIKKRPGLYSRSDWAAIIDSTWGPGLPTNEKLAIFNTFCDAIDQDFACFQDLNVNWDSLRSVYYSEISSLNGVSRGRFAAIMNYLSLALKEAHTNCEDKIVNWTTPLAPGIPLLVVGGWGVNTHFGACLTPRPDSSLLVYKTVDGHPLGLVQGDVVLGYDNVPWKILYKQLLAAQLPIAGWWWGCSKSAYEHSWLMSAGMNWHLFDTLDVVKYYTGDTLHLPTAPLAGQTTSILGTEQMDIPGVPKPNLLAQDYVNWGIVSGTQIGYIYVMGWTGNAGDEFLQAVNDLMFNHETTGLIIDFRLNYGGNMFLSNPALELLFNTTVETIGFACRADPNNHLTMFVCAAPSFYNINGNPSTYYDKPIAVLTGPGAVSSGDQVALRMKFHPRARVFGKSTTAAFNAPTILDLGNSDWTSRYADADAFLVSNPGHYLTHDEFIVDEEVWLTPDDVAQGYDTVVKAAIAWMDSQITSIPQPVTAEVPASYRLYQNYPNPFNPSTHIKFRLPAGASQAGIAGFPKGAGAFVELKVYDVSGREVATLVSENLAPGEYRLQWDGKDALGNPLSSGVYFYRLTAGSFTQTRKMILMK